MTNTTKIKASLAIIGDQLAADDASATKREIERVAVHEAIHEELARIEAELDGEPGLPVLSIADAEPVRAGGDAKFEVTLSRKSAKPVTFEFDAFAGTFEFPPGGWTLAPGDESIIASVRVLPDAPAGQATVHLLVEEDDATLGRSTATCTILPADTSLPKASLHDAADTLPGGTMVFLLTLDKPSAVDVAITLNVSGATLTSTLAAGLTSLDVEVPIPANAMPTTMTAKITAIEGLEIADGEAKGKVVTTPPSSGDLPASGSNVTSPIVSPAGAWRELRTFAAKVKLDSAPSVHVKVAGGDSTANAFGGWVLERHNGGQMQAWVYVGGIAQKAMSTGQLPLGTSVFVAVRLFPTKIVLTMGGMTFSKVFTGTPDAFDGPSVVGDGYWKHALSGAWPGKIEEWTALPTALSDAELAALADEWMGEPPNGNGNGNGGPPPSGLEPVNSNAVQVAAEVGGEALHTWIGFGHGWNTHAGAISVKDRVEQYASQIWTEHGATVMRLWTPEKPVDFLAGYKKIYEVGRAHGVKRVLATGFVWRGGITPEKLADGVKSCIDGGIEITELGLQNEPDAPLNSVNMSQLVDYYRRCRARLDQHGLQRVKIIGLEYAHCGGSMANQEFDLIDGAGQVSGTVSAGGGHAYSDCLRPSIFRDRWWKRRAGIWSTETGNLGMPHGIARSICQLNQGAVTEIAHIAMISTVNPTGEPAAQAMVYGDGRRAPWHAQYAATFGPRHNPALPEGTVMRPVTSSDRWGGISEEYARHMVRSPGKNPRVQMAAGKRPQGDWYFAAANTTKGGGESSVYVGACAPAATIQVTARIAELAGRSGTFIARRCDAGGNRVADRSIALVDGYTRFTLQAGELAVLLGGV